jgi:transposase
MGMYLRTTSRTNRDGSTVTYLQLAHNERNPDTGHSTAKIIHNFGREDAVDREALVRLCESIARVCGVEVRDVLQQTDTRAAVAALPDDVTLRRTRTLGTVHVVDALWRRLGIKRVLDDLGQRKRWSVPYERALFAMVANRLCEPESKLGVWERWLDTVHLPECRALELHHMYEALDRLHEHSAEIEEAVFFETASLLNLEVDLVFFDTTTCSFAIDEVDGDDGLRQRGHSKEGTWRPQVVIALAVTREGLPVRSWVFEGNTSDVTLIDQVRADLRGWKLGRALFVADSGFNSADNRAELARGCGHYVLACRMRSSAELAEVTSRAGRYKDVADNLRVKEVIVDEGTRQRRYLVCHNEQQAARESQHREAVLAELEEILSNHPDEAGSANKKWAMELLTSRRFGRYLRKTKTGRLRIDRGAAAEAAKLDGKWVLLTNDDSLAVEDVADAYKSLLVIESCFRSLKSTQIEIRPMYHWLARRIVAHVKVCVLALLIQRVAELAVGRSWRWISHDLDAVQATEFETETHRFFQVNELPSEAGSVLRALDIKPPRRVLDVEKVPAEV